MIKQIVFSILMVLSGSVFADTYPATDTNPTYRLYAYAAGTHEYSTQDQACSAETWSGEVYSWDAAHGACKSVRLSDGYTTYTAYLILTHHYSCPYSGTLSGASCINADACLAPNARDTTTGECKPPPVVCSATEYDNGGVCTPIPDCNSNSLTGGNFFNTVTKACESVSPITICISDVNPKFCPPINDCKPSGYICSDSPSAVAAAAAARDSEIAAVKAAAKAKKDEIVQIALQSEAAAAAKRAANAAAESAKNAAKAAVDAAKATNDQSAISQAFDAYRKFANDYIETLSRQANSESAAAKAKEIDKSADFPVAQIPTANPGNAKAYDKQVEKLLGEAIKALDDAVSGDGSGTGPGSGQPTSTTPQLDTKDLNKESTQKKIADALGIPDGTPDLTDSDKPVRDAMQGIIDDVHGVDTSLGTNPSATLGMTSSYWGYASGTCFPAVFDMGRFGNVSLENFCNIYDTHIRPLLVMVLGVFGVLHVFSYWHTTVRESMG